MKNPKRRIIPCDINGCFHIAHRDISVGGRKMNVCDCHFDGSICRETAEEKELLNFKDKGDCVFCGTSNSHNPIFGLEGKVIFVCDRCYITPIGESNRTYNRK